MSDALTAIVRTRNVASQILADAVKIIDNKSEKEIADSLVGRLQSWPDVYGRGWYEPPPAGVAVLFGKTPFDRLKYETLRDPEYFPRGNINFNKETVAHLHICPVDRASGLFGDFGGTIYLGDNASIRGHVKTVRDVIIEIADHAQVGMTFSELFAFAQSQFTAHQKVIGWMSTVHDTMQTNLGHTVPGSYDITSPKGSFEEVKEYIQKNRVFINANQTFVIPSTCAFTVEARLTDPSFSLPNVYFHVIVIFSGDEKSILTNFDEMFKAAGMTYML